VSAEQLSQIAEIGISRKNGGISWSSEVSFDAAACKVQSLLLDGQVPQATRAYRILVSDYLAGGGSGFDALKLTDAQKKILDGGPVQRDLVIEALKTWGKPLSATEFFDPAHPHQKISTPCGSIQ
jgi:2',3'-cyclic-nucleotide 2'-phosphodiesterase (5'-nucleotidase family)